VNPTYPFDQPITIECTAQDCADGVRGTQCYCVVATSLVRFIKGARHPLVNLDNVSFSIKHEGEKYRIIYITPPEVREYIRVFDAGEIAKPFTFTLTDPVIEHKKKGDPRQAKLPRRPQGEPQVKVARVFGAKTLIPVDA
jgi:hypothetical protein